MATCSSCGKDLPAGEFAFCPHCAAPLAVRSSQRELRKTVTIVFCDIVGSTARGESTDPEALRALLARYFERMSAIVERHGGTVEKFIGDAVMAVFGVPVLHEDDALRAVRAAVEMRDALPELAVQARIGVNTGEVVTGTSERLATGDAVNVAARLEQAAAPGEVLLGSETLRLVRDTVEVEPVEPLELKGKSHPVAAFRLVAVREGQASRQDGVFVGRERERRLLREAFELSVGDRGCQLVTMLGAAGIGKSRLVAEFLRDVDAQVVSGHCLSYGDGITYWPVVEVVKPLRPDELELDPPVAAALRALLGSNEQASTGDIAFAVRRLFEAVAAERPLVVVWDDLQWAEPAFLDLIEHVADWSRDAPILLLCLARPELLDRRPGWGGGKLRATALLLEPLPHELCETMLDELGGLLDTSLRERVLAAADGNPLFVEEMVAMLRDSPQTQVSVPPTITALLAARLDQLGTDERGTLERGSVEGQVFHRSSIEALAPDDPQAGAHLMGLVRKELVRPEKATFPGDDAFRFRHILIRDAAYDALPKATRAELHQRFAAWLELRVPGLVELDEILGYHLEQAWLYRRELGLPDDPGLAAGARARLKAAEQRAIFRRDFRAACNLTERALALVPPDEVDAELEIDHADALTFAGNLQAGREALRVGIDRAAKAGDGIAGLAMRIEEATFQSFTEPAGSFARLAAVVDEALPQFEESGADFGLFLSYWATGYLALNRGQADAYLEASERAVAYARRLPSAHQEAWARPGLAAARFYGSTPLTELLGWLETEEAAGWLQFGAQAHRSLALAMLGRFAEARADIASIRALLRERGNAWDEAAHAGTAGRIELLADDPAAAEAYFAEECAFFEGQEEAGTLSTASGWRAHALFELGQLDDAEAWARRAAELGDPEDMFTQIPWRSALAKVHASREERDDALLLAGEAVTMALATDLLNFQGDAYSDQAEVFILCGQPAEAAAAFEEARERYARKGNLVGAARAKARFETVGAGGFEPP